MPVVTMCKKKSIYVLALYNFKELRQKQCEQLYNFYRVGILLKAPQRSGDRGFIPAPLPCPIILQQVCFPTRAFQPKTENTL